MVGVLRGNYGLGIKLPRQNWNPDEIAILRELYPKIKPIHIAERLGRSLNSVMVKAGKLHLLKRGQLSEEERLCRSQMMHELRLSGKIKYTSMSKERREQARQRMLILRPQRKTPVSAEERRRASARMKQNNPMKQSHVVARVVHLRRERGDYRRFGELTQRLWAEGKLKHIPITQEQREAASQRMKAHNPMFNPETVRKVVLVSRWRHFSDPKAYAERLIRKNIGPNKTEARIEAALQPLGFRFVGDGKFWIGPCLSGKCRNPDFIWKSGRKKVGLLYHSNYWHNRPDSDDEEELRDYQALGWQIFVFREGDLSKFAEAIRRVQEWLVGLR